MLTIRDYLKQKILLSDGATGTYISALLGRNVTACELLNKSDPDTVLNLHQSYLSAGAKLIKTNTFSANTFYLEKSAQDVAELIKSGVALARAAARDNAYVAADIGPLRCEQSDGQAAGEEYIRNIDTFLSEGVDIFLFETFASSVFQVKMARYIKSRNPEAFIIADFAVAPDGNSRMGVKGQTLINEVAKSGQIEAAGFNCMSGPAHLVSYASGVDYKNLIPVIMPNAGYPQFEQDLCSYSGSPDYFASKMEKAVSSGFKIVGGCCGTTPDYIRALSTKIHTVQIERKRAVQPVKTEEYAKKPERPFTQLLYNKKAVLVELDPPFNSDISKLEAAAETLKSCGVDALTIADSPMARPRADSVAVAARLKRKTGIEVIPHLSCRDKNLNAIKSCLLAAHMEEIRNILAVTGDPVPDTDKAAVKSVFNINSVGLCNFVKDLNDDIFRENPVACGCAFNVNARNTDHELLKLSKKAAAGASFILTQPVFSDQSIEALQRAKQYGLPVIAGILTPVSYKNALFLKNELPGISLPDEILARFSQEMSREQGEKTGIEISVQIAERISKTADGFYFIVPFNRVHVTVEVISKLKSKNIL